MALRFFSLLLHNQKQKIKERKKTEAEARFYFLRARKRELEALKKLKAEGIFREEIPDFLLPENNNYYKELEGKEDNDK